LFGYDNNGNMTSVANISNPAIPTATYAYRPDNMMIRAVTGAGETTYEYDGDQRRVARTADAGTAAA
jgi:YD repeat-containing protein